MNRSATIFLPWIDPVKILEKYKRGEYANTVCPNIAQKIQAKVTPAIAEKYGNNMMEDRFQIKINNGGEMVIIAIKPTTTADGKKKKIRCKRCKRKLYPDPNFIYETVVIRRESHQVLSCHNGIPQMSVEREFFTIQPHCDLNCAIGSILDNPHGYPPDAESNTRYLHSCLFPGAGILMPAEDPEVLEDNGGTYTYEEYKKDRNERLRPIAGVTITPLTQCFARI